MLQDTLRRLPLMDEYRGGGSQLLPQFGPPSLTRLLSALSAAVVYYYWPGGGPFGSSLQRS